jgi:hypothetical protein
MPVGCDSHKDQPPSLSPRPCCLLTTAIFSGILEESEVTKYTYGFSTSGLMYTCNGGFLDFGHVFDNIELTFYYHHFLTKGGANTPGKTFTGNDGEKLTIKTAIAAADRPTVAASMAFDAGVFHEIITYWVSGGGAHNSSFSPEDLVSNYVATRIAERALKATGKKFDEAVRDELKKVLALLKPCTKAQTKAALQAIDGTWVTDVTGGTFDQELDSDDYLKHRNVNVASIAPCYVSAPGTGCGATPAFPASDLGTSYPNSIRDSYDAEYVVSVASARTKLGAKLKKSSFTSSISAITSDPKVGTLCP